MMKPDRITTIFFKPGLIEMYPEILDPVLFLTRTAQELCDRSKSLEELECSIKELMPEFEFVLIDPNRMEYSGGRDAVLMVCDHLTDRIH